MTFRRGIRFFLLCIAVSLIVLAAVFIGWIPSKLPDTQWNAAAELINYARCLDQELFRMWVWGVSYRILFLPALDHTCGIQVLDDTFLAAPARITVPHDYSTCTQCRHDCLSLHRQTLGYRPVHLLVYYSPR